MNPRLALVLSVVFHPLLLPSYLFALILFYLPVGALTFPVEGRRLVWIMVFLTTFLIPGLGAYAMRRAGQISSLTLESRADRRWPLLFAAACYTVTTVLFYRQTYFDDLFFYVMAIITASVYMTLVINQFWKISAHAIGVGGALGILVLLYDWLPEPHLFYPAVIGIAIAGAVLSARLALGAHNTKQVYTGFILGFLLGVILWGLPF
ncbi:hypothetical protein [Nibribacter koreensis]|uniref:PAP2 superfamily protein n=1 Tax=Nibribacter koreensis TaxID=1084519 RepID=A0ABP8FMS1_9BACT